MIALSQPETDNHITFEGPSMFLMILAACDGGGAVPGASIDPSALWAAAEGQFQVYRELTAEEYAAFDPAALLDEADLLSSQYALEGCESGSGWRVELRTGGAWEGAAAAGALHFSAGSAVSICGWESPSGELEAYDPPASFFMVGEPLRAGIATVSGDWAVTPERAFDVPTYFGTFPQAATFRLAGPGTLDGWTFTLAENAGIVLIQAPEFTADLIYTR